MTTTDRGGLHLSAYERWTERTANNIEQLLAQGRQHPLTSPSKPGVPARPYNGANLFALHIAGLVEYTSYRWLTYKQAQAVGA